MKKVGKLLFVLVITCIFTLLLTFQALACDTYVALENATKDGSVLFGKTSCRQNNECQWQAHYPRKSYGRNEMLQATHMQIPQVPMTYEVRGGQPYWGWGFEYGMNEYGVCIGNELINTKDPVYPAEDGKSLTGLDLVRLGLERGKTAYEAMHIIIDLIEKYGQNGNCTNLPGDAYIYWNSFLIADPNGAWVLETSDKNWVAKKVKDVYAISNIATIRTIYDECSKDLVTHAVEQGWCKADEPFDFAKYYTNFHIWPYYGETKLARSTSMLKENYGKVDLNTMMSIQRDHYEGTMLESRFGMYQVLGTLCGHDATESNAGGMIGQLRNDPDLAAPIQNIYWGIMSSACISAYKPFYFLGDSPKELMVGDGQYSEDSPWWSYDLLERLVAQDPEAFHPMVTGVWHSLEMDEFVATEMKEKEATRLFKAGKTQEASKLLNDFTQQNCDQQWAVAKSLAQAMRIMWPTLPHKTDLLYGDGKVNKAANIVLFP
jgi:secernin